MKLKYILCTILLISNTACKNEKPKDIVIPKNSEISIISPRFSGSQLKGDVSEGVLVGLVEVNTKKLGVCLFSSTLNQKKNNIFLKEMVCAKSGEHVAINEDVKINIKGLENLEKIHIEKESNTMNKAISEEEAKKIAKQVLAIGNVYTFALAVISAPFSSAVLLVAYNPETVREYNEVTEINKGQYKSMKFVADKEILLKIYDEKELKHKYNYNY